MEYEEFEDKIWASIFTRNAEEGKAHNVEAVARTRFDEFLKQSPTTAANIKTDADRETLFKQFQAWETERNARAQVRSGSQK